MFTDVCAAQFGGGQVNVMPPPVVAPWRRLQWLDV